METRQLEKNLAWTTLVAILGIVLFFAGLVWNSARNRPLFGERFVVLPHPHWEAFPPCALSKNKFTYVDSKRNQLVIVLAYGIDDLLPLSIRDCLPGGARFARNTPWEMIVPARENRLIVVNLVARSLDEFPLDPRQAIEFFTTLNESMNDSDEDIDDILRSRYLREERQQLLELLEISSTIRPINAVGVKADPDAANAVRFLDAIRREVQEGRLSEAEIRTNYPTFYEQAFQESRSR